MMGGYVVKMGMPYSLHAVHCLMDTMITPVLGQLAYVCTDYSVHHAVHDMMHTII